MTPHRHDEPHDRGLPFDLQTIAARRASTVTLPRRRLLALAGAGAAGLVVAACSKGGGAASGASTSTTSTTAASGASTSIAATPAETAGPYPGDGSNGPDVLTESGVVREDIRSSFGGLSGTAAGLPLTIRFEVVTAATGAALATRRAPRTCRGPASSRTWSSRTATSWSWAR